MRGAAYAHEIVTLPPGNAPDFLEALRDVGRSAVEAVGLTLVGAFQVAMTADAGCIVIWAIPDWGTWTRFEQEQHENPLKRWRHALTDLRASWRRTLLVDAPLAPYATPPR